MVDPKTGGPVYFGRSLTYRFGIAAPFALAGVLELEGESRRAGRCWSQVLSTSSSGARLMVVNSRLGGLVLIVGSGSDTLARLALLGV